MMNFEEGFRRIGIATYWLAIIFGIIALCGTFNWFFALLVGFSVIILFHIGIYVAKGFMRESDRKKTD